jgi:hypothetical protein
MFRLKSAKRAIKKTHWYAMSAANQVLIPQAKEHITKASWKKSEFIYKSDVVIYNSIVNIVEEYMRKEDVLGIKL